MVYHYTQMLYRVLSPIHLNTRRIRRQQNELRLCFYERMHYLFSIFQNDWIIIP